MGSTTPTTASAAKGLASALLPLLVLVLSGVRSSSATGSRSSASPMSAASRAGAAVAASLRRHGSRGSPSMAFVAPSGPQLQGKWRHAWSGKAERSSRRRSFSSSHHLRKRRQLDAASSEAEAEIPAVESGEAAVVTAEQVKSPFLKTLISRGFFHQCTDLEGLDAKLMKGEPVKAYLGFDATADSLHVGSLLQIMILRHLQKSGNKPIVLVGGGTTKVGDPSGKDESRQMLDDAAIGKNIEGIASVFTKFLDFGDGPTDALLVDNDDWLSGLGYIAFLRDYGPLFTINRMLSFESVKTRLSRENPMTFLEFNYMLLQAYDFVELYRRNEVCLQMGGSDQWGNMVNGVELGRRVEGASLFALTAPLITTSDGKKMGKTAAGAVWLNKDKLSEYDYWQFWRNVDDADVVRFLKLFTEVPMDKIEEIAKAKGSALNDAKVVLADEATRLLHGEACLKNIHETVAQIFSGKGGGSSAALPRIVIPSSRVEGEGASVVDFYVELELATSKGEVRRLIKGGGAKLNDEKIVDDKVVLTEGDFSSEGEVKLSFGKKKHGIVQLQQD